jgi:hypothetical protein
MPVSNFGLDTLTRYPGFGYGWSNQDFAPPDLFSKRESTQINQVVSLAVGDKVRVVARLYSGPASQTAPETVRLRMRKRL